MELGPASLLRRCNPSPRCWGHMPGRLLVVGICVGRSEFCPPGFLCRNDSLPSRNAHLAAAGPKRRDATVLQYLQLPLQSFNLLLDLDCPLQLKHRHISQEAHILRLLRGLRCDATDSEPNLFECKALFVPLFRGSNVCKTPNHEHFSVTMKLAEKPSVATLWPTR